jgi:very-short-patch-repair endonuclease
MRDATEVSGDGRRPEDPVVIARRLRQSMTPAESALWFELRRTKLDGSHFRRQSPIGPFIVDFACRSAKLVVEIDGNAHDSLGACEKDLQRDSWFTERGFEVLRFTNAEVLANVKRVAQVIAAAAEARVLRRPTP